MRDDGDLTTDRTGHSDHSVGFVEVAVNERRVRVGSVGDIGAGQVVRVDADDLPEPVAVFNVDGQLYALGDLCSHGAASLSEGWLEGCRVECPLHFSQFDLATGVACNLPATKPVATYEVRVEDDEIHLIVAASNSLHADKGT